MKPGAIVTIVVILIVVAAVVMSGRQPVDEPKIEEVRARIESSEPAWANYLEDLKGQIGSAPVARWRGDITSASASEGTVTVHFTVAEYWLEHQIAIPMLVRDNLGYVTRDSQAVYDGTSVTYTFVVRQQTPPPWVEIQFPNNTRRLAFDADGKWTAPASE